LLTVGLLRVQQGVAAATKQIQAHESTGEATSQKQLGGLKKISRQIFRNSHASMRTERTYRRK
jgi:hypothetical protein